MGEVPSGACPRVDEASPRRNDVKLDMGVHSHLLESLSHWGGERMSERLLDIVSSSTRIQTAVTSGHSLSVDEALDIARTALEDNASATSAFVAELSAKPDVQCSLS